MTITCARALALPAAALAAALAAGGCKQSSAADVAKGRELFASACARCHGSDGSGGLPLFDGGPSPRNFREHAFQAEHTDEQIRVAIVNGKGTGMPPFGTTFDDAQLRALVAAVRSFDGQGAR